MTATVQRIRNYEELDGATGREVFFRPHRYRAADLEPLTANVYLRRGQEDAAVRCALFDISQNGVAFEWPQSEPIAAGDSLSELTVGFDEHVAYRGEAKVGSVREIDGACVIGVSFDQLIDIDEVLQMRSIRAWTGRDGRGLSHQARPWNVPGHSQYKAMISDLALYFEDAQAQMTELESELDWAVVQGRDNTPARQALIARIRREFVPHVVSASEAIDAALREAPEAHKKQLNDFSLRQLDKYLMQAPWMHRARFKPFGYPGDYEVMRFVYERNFEGNSLFAKAVGYAFLQTKAALAVKYRKDLVKQQLRNVIDAHGRTNKKPLRFLSIAAGPAQELVDLFAELPGLNCPLELVLFDQDKSALSYSYRRLKPAAEAKFGSQVKILYLNESIKRLLRDADLFSSFGHFDAIYSAGLYDYLQPTTAVILTRNLFARLVPGGALYIGNMAPENPCRWFMESHLDWHLIHRTRQEMCEIGARANGNAQIRVLEEDAGVNPFIELRSH